ncbi:hypothetical protein [Luteibacter aegosomatissinici]|uniref:hypothetical protein n=1 Tax=Luteibacter aegosomatissinici TaxID=2911539 RepID=UPI001FF7BF33|nr:hypothetical protein [Luteibacter aegosomatissinici]UPG96612.1 hypothetical protein L2Y97_10990 [Luteibacter aegosomatissinici]
MTRYESLKLFFRIYVDTELDLGGLPDEHRPMYVLAEMEKKAPARAREGLRIALGDVMEDLEHASPDQLARLSVRLAAEGAPSIAAVRAMMSKKVAAVLKRGVIANETEFYLLRNVLEAPGIPDDERGKIADMLDQFEFAPR